MRILFHSVEEFVDELAKDLTDARAEIHRRILRLTRRYMSAHQMPVRHLFVDASYKVNGEVVSLEVYCGQLWGERIADVDAFEKSNKTFGLLTEFATANALEIRGGAAVETDVHK